MNPDSHSLLLIIRKLIRAHHERGDENRIQQYIPRLQKLAAQIESGEFQRFPVEQQIGTLRALRGEYLGRGEVFWLLAPKYLEPEYEQALAKAIQEYLDGLQL